MSTTYYRVQVGAFSKKENAEALIKKLKKFNFPASIIEADGLSKVICGSFTIKANADTRLRDVHSAGFRDALIVVVKGKSDPVIDEFLALCKNNKSHQWVIDTLKKHGHSIKSSDAWCSETVMAVFYKLGLINKIGGYSADAPSIRSKAKRLGIWHDGSKGIQAKDIVLYGSGTPNHTEFAVDDTYNVSGNYNGKVAKRKRSGRTINGYVRPKY